MVMLKISSFLAVYALVACQMENYQAIPLRRGVEPATDQGKPGEYEGQRLLNALLKYARMTKEELERAGEEESLDKPISKRCAGLSTCVLGKLTEELHKLQTFPPTEVGPGTPGKKRNGLQSDRYANYEEEVLGSN